MKMVLFKLYAWILCFLFCVAFWLIIISLASCNNAAQAETVPKAVYLTLFNQSKVIKKENDSLKAAKALIEKKFNELNLSFDSLQAYQKTKIEILQDSLFGFKTLNDSTIEQFLTIVNDAVIKNIDSIHARIKRNYK